MICSGQSMKQTGYKKMGIVAQPFLDFTEGNAKFPRIRFLPYLLG